jgi:hypothetical protein
MRAQAADANDRIALCVAAQQPPYAHSHVPREALARCRDREHARSAGRRVHRPHRGRPARASVADGALAAVGALGLLHEVGPRRSRALGPGRGGSGRDQDVRAVRGQGAPLLAEPAIHDAQQAQRALAPPAQPRRWVWTLDPLVRAAGCPRRRRVRPAMAALTATLARACAGSTASARRTRRWSSSRTTWWSNPTRSPSCSRSRSSSTSTGSVASRSSPRCSSSCASTSSSWRKRLKTPWRRKCKPNASPRPKRDRQRGGQRYLRQCLISERVAAETNGPDRMSADCMK